MSTLNEWALAFGFAYTSFLICKLLTNTKALHIGHTLLEPTKELNDFNFYRGKEFQHWTKNYDKNATIDRAFTTLESRSVWPMLRS